MQCWISTTFTYDDGKNKINKKMGLKFVTIKYQTMAKIPLCSRLFLCYSSDDDCYCSQINSHKS